MQLPCQNDAKQTLFFVQILNACFAGNYLRFFFADFLAWLKTGSPVLEKCCVVKQRCGSSCRILHQCAKENSSCLPWDTSPWAGFVLHPDSECAKKLGDQTGLNPLIALRLRRSLLLRGIVRRRRESNWSTGAHLCKIP